MLSDNIQCLGWTKCNAVLRLVGPFITIPSLGILRHFLIECDLVICRLKQLTGAVKVLPFDASDRHLEMVIASGLSSGVLNVLLHFMQNIRALVHHLRVVASVCGCSVGIGHVERHVHAAT